MSLELPQVDLLRLPEQDPCPRPGEGQKVFTEQLRGFVFSSEAIAQHLGEVDEVIVGKRELLETLRSEEELVREEAEKLYRLYLEGGLSVQGFRERNDPLEKRREQLASEIPPPPGRDRLPRHPAGVELPGPRGGLDLV